MEANFVKLMHTKGERVVDCDGTPIGKVAQVACEPTTFAAGWLVVKTSLVDRPRLVPVDCAIEEAGMIRVPISRYTVIDAPVPVVAVAPAMTECAALDEHYQRAA